MVLDSKFECLVPVQWQKCSLSVITHVMCSLRPKLECLVKWQKCSHSMVAHVMCVVLDCNFEYLAQWQKYSRSVDAHVMCGVRPQV